MHNVTQSNANLSAVSSAICNERRRLRSSSTCSQPGLRISSIILIASLLSAVIGPGVVIASSRPKRTYEKSRSAKTGPESAASPVRRISAAEHRLAAMGYWTGRLDGRIDPQTRSALIAFQKAEGLARTGRFSPEDLIAISTAVPISPREQGAYHVEVDLDRQILFLVSEDGTVSNVLPISTGGGEDFTSEGWTREAVTPTGRFRIREKIEGWHKGPIGRLYYPNYIVGGVAIHGYPSVPVHAASHGCIRIPMFAAKRFSELTPIGTVVLVYGSRPGKTPGPGIERRSVAKSDG